MKILPANATQETEKKIFDLIQSGSNGDYTPVRQVVLNVFEKIEKASQTKGSITGLETGFTKLDHQLSGLQPSDMILIAARPSVGKTAFVLNITETVAVKHNIVDYLHLMTTNGRASSREQEIAEISRTLKGIARELNVPVIALSQLNRAAETREDKKPIMADLRESGSIEQDADVVMLMSRFYDKETKTEDRNRIIVNVAKQRNGPVGEVELVWLPQYTKFENAETEQV